MRQINYMRLQNTVRLKIKLRRVAWISLSWTLAAVFDNINTNAIIASNHLQPTIPLQSDTYLSISILSAFLASILSGLLLVFYLRERFRKESFGVGILINGFIISTLNILVSAIVYNIYFSLKFKHFPLHEEVLHASSQLFSDSLFLKNLLFWFVVVMLTIIFLHVNEKYGPSVFRKLLLGRYHHPREEERIFMFVDIRSSTTIAEQIGHLRFFELLNDFFRDLTNPILYTSGEIYQYVGDEIVISWPMAAGIKNANCIRCFYSIRATLETLSHQYKEKYGLVPVVKAGLHCGSVTTGEIGVIKKDIVYSGDVMNTASRIQAKCNEFGVDILLSKYLLDKLKLAPDEFPRSRMGMIELRGKKKKVELYSFGDEQVEER